MKYAIHTALEAREKLGQLREGYKLSRKTFNSCIHLIHIGEFSYKMNKDRLFWAFLYVLFRSPVIYPEHYD